MIHYCQLSSNSTSHPYLIMSRRLEIKQKQELQARFQLAMSANNQKALNWLKPLKSTASTTSTSSETPNANNPTSDDSFMDLQIIPQGASLSKLDNLQKIGDFINSKDITKMKQSTTTTTTASNLTSNRVTKSKPMLALMNKMRDSNRKNVRQNQHHQQQQQQSTSSINGKSNKPMIPNKSQSIVKNYNNEEEDDDDEEDDEDSRAIRSRTVKKGSNLLLENKLNNKNSGTKKKNVRPF